MNVKRITSPVRLVSLLVLAGVAWAGLAGCTSVQVAPDTRGEFKFGELQVFEEKTFAQVYEAAKAGIKDNKLFLTQDDKKVVEAELKARDSADTHVIVKIKEVAKGRTSLKIRYGINPDLPSAQRLYEAIRKRM